MWNALVYKLRHRLKHETGYRPPLRKGLSRNGNQSHILMNLMDEKRIEEKRLETIFFPPLQ